MIAAIIAGLVAVFGVTMAITFLCALLCMGFAEPYNAPQRKDTFWNWPLSKVVRHLWAMWKARKV